MCSCMRLTCTHTYVNAAVHESWHAYGGQSATLSAVLAFHEGRAMSLCWFSIVYTKLTGLRAFSFLNLSLHFPTPSRRVAYSTAFRCLQRSGKSNSGPYISQPVLLPMSHHSSPSMVFKENNNSVVSVQIS